jgi:hypothetical protein
VVVLGAILTLLCIVQTRGTLWVAAPALILAVLARPTNFIMFGIAGTISAVILCRGRRLVQVVLAVWACAVCAVPISIAVNKVIFQTANSFAERSLIVFDVAGISTALHQNLFVTLSGWPDQLARPWDCYETSSWDPFEFGNCKEYGRSFEAIARKEGTSSILRWWIAIVVAHPLAYLNHRLLYAYSAVRSMPAMDSWRTPYASNRVGEDISGIWTYGKDMTGVFQPWAPTIGFIPFGLVARAVFNGLTVALALVLCLWTIVSLYRRSRTIEGDVDRVLCAAAAIGLANFLMYAGFGVATDARYMFPTVACGFVCAVSLIPCRAPSRA